MIIIMTTAIVIIIVIDILFYSILFCFVYFEDSFERIMYNVKAGFW